MSASPLLLDACVVINIAACGIDPRELAEINGYAFVAVSTVALETLFLNAGGQGGAREAINLEQWSVQGMVTLTQLSPIEIGYFIDLARELDDGEAATLAAAVCRGLPVATDDRKAIRVAGEQDPPVTVVSTSTLLRTWARETNAPQRDVSEALTRIEVRASFLPNRSDPHHSWWTASR